jgi:pyruvate-formate lyase-activating enzyme
MVSIDPNGKCDFNCPHCNARKSIKDVQDYQMDVDMNNSVIRVLKFWKTRAVCIGGGG